MTKSKDGRTIEQVETELAAARARLVTTVDDLADAVSPQQVAARQVERVKGFFVQPDGSMRTDHVAKIGGAVAGLLALRTVVRRRSR